MALTSLFLSKAERTAKGLQVTLRILLAISTMEQQAQLLSALITIILDLAMMAIPLIQTQRARSITVPMTMLRAQQVSSSWPDTSARMARRNSTIFSSCVLVAKS